MCQKSFNKSNSLLKKLENVDCENVENVTEQICSLFKKMCYNLKKFQQECNSASDKYKQALENNNAPKKKSRLSLKKNGDTQNDEDWDNLSIECIEPSTSKEPQNRVSEEVHEEIDEENDENGDTENDENWDNLTIERIEPSTSKEVQNSVIEEVREEVDKSDEDDSSANDSQSNIPPVCNFDAPTKNSFQEEFIKHTESCQSLSNRSLQNIQENHARNESESETQSFDFDDEDDQNNKTLEKVDKEQDAYNESHKNNCELLELLTKAVDKHPDYITTDQEGDEALQLLEDEFSESNMSDSDDSELYWLISSDGEDSDEIWSLGSFSSNAEEQFENVECKNLSIDLIRVDQLSDETFAKLCRLNDVDKNKCSLEWSEDDEVASKDLCVKLTRVDEFSDAAIDRLCDLNNIDRKKCGKVLERCRHRLQMKRRRILSTSSSESLSDSFSSDGSTTPDLDLTNINQSAEQLPASSHDQVLNDFADQLFDRMSDTDAEIVSSSSDTEIDEECKKKKRKTEPEKSDETNQEKEKQKVKKKRRPSWQKDVLLTSRLWSSESSSSDEETTNKGKLGTNQEKNKIFEEVCLVISDSTLDTDSSVECTGEVSETRKKKGRKNIHKIMSESELNILTQKAKSEEDERIQRLEEHSKTLEVILSQQQEAFVLDFDVTTKDPLIVVDEVLAKKLKPHQKEGVRFMWEACYESVEMLKKANSGTGCILAHCMGLGKTLQVVTLIHTLLVHKVTNTKHILIACPLSTVNNWKNEFKMAFDLFEERPKIRLEFLISQEAQEKCALVKEWRQKGGVIVMGYETFQRFSSGIMNCSAEEKKRVYEALVDPGPDLIVCDEGHLLKNVGAQRSQALMQIKTKRRIVLTGTPLQNNLTEYFYMVDFVKKHLLGNFGEYQNRFANPIMNGQYDDSRPEDIKLMKKRAHVLTKLLKKTIHRVDTKILQTYLPEIKDYTIFVRLEPIQIELYKKYIELAKAHNGPITKTTGFFQDFRMTKLITLHPYTIQLYYNEVRKNRKRKKKKADMEGDVEETVIPRISEGWYDELFPLDVASNIEYSSKLKVIMSLINEAVRNGEKILVFAHLLPELDLVEHFLKTYGTADFPHWRHNEDYYRMDGEVNPPTRSNLCDNFNLDPDVKVFLISHGVGGLGLNLTAASRVILIGSNHNPSVDTQSIYRVYRFGQMRSCYVYRVLSLGAMEEKIYHRCVQKLAVAGTVVDKYHFDRHYKCKDLQAMYQYNFDVEGDRPIPAVPADKLLAKLLQHTADIYKYHEHSALLENRPEEELNDEEKKLAWDEFKKAEEAGKNGTVLPIQQNNPSNVLPHLLPSTSSAQVRPYLQSGAPLNNRIQLPKQPNYQMQYFPLGRNSINLNRVPNPLNTGARNMFQRGVFHNQGNNMAQISGNQSRPSGSSIYTPQYNGYNRNVPNRPQTLQNNSSVQLLQQNNHGQPSTSASSMDRSARMNAVSQGHSTRNQPQYTANEVPLVGEFNYTLNKVV